MAKGKGGMEVLSAEVSAYLERRFVGEGVPESDRPAYRKWARFYLDFCVRYSHSPRSPDSLAPFLAKLEQKRQGPRAREQAAATVRLMLGKARHRLPPDTGRGCTGDGGNPSGESREVRRPPAAIEGVPARFAYHQPRGDDGTPRRQTGCSWAAQFEALTGAIRMRNYSGKTLTAYRTWVGKFQGEVEALIEATDPAFRLPVLLMYGCGLRLAECIGLRLHNFNLDERLLTVHDGKGQKDRTVS